MDQNDRYTVTIYAAAPGTPLINPERPDTPRETSLTGHMYLKVAHGEEARSMGWQPGTRTPDGYLGRVSADDVDTYVDPYYARTIEVSREQYEKIQEFGRAPTRFGFDPKYDAFSNGCTDFTWGALNHAGLHANVGPVPFKGFEGILQPTKNIPAIESIKAPFPDSDLNKVEQPLAGTRLEAIPAVRQRPRDDGPGEPRCGLARRLPRPYPGRSQRAHVR